MNKKSIFHKNELIDNVLQRNYQTFSLTLNTSEFVAQKYNDKISKYIFKNMRKEFREIDRLDRKYLRGLKKQEREKILAQRAASGVKKMTFKSFMKKLFLNRKILRSLKEKKEIPEDEKNGLSS
jgi:hypothetical protein